MGSEVERELVFASTALQSRKRAPELLDALLAGLLAGTGGRAAVVLPCSNLESIAPWLPRSLAARAMEAAQPCLLGSQAATFIACWPLNTAGSAKIDARAVVVVQLTPSGSEMPTVDLERLSPLVAQAAARLESIALREALEAEVLARQRAEEALRETHAAMIKHQQVGQMCDFRFNTVNGRSTSSPEGYKLFDFPSDLEIIEYEDWASKVHPEDRRRIEAAVAQAAAARQPMRFEYRIIRRGEIRHISCDGQVDTEHEGDQTYYGVLTDVTDRKAVESALRDLQSQLAAANRLASLGELAGSIVHEVNQPLTAITTHAEAGLRWLSHVPPNLSEARESLGNVVAEATRAATVVKGLRNIARGGPAEFTTIDVNPIIDEVLMLARSSTERANVAVQLVLENTLAPVKGDRTQVQQVVFNLVQNAIDALLPITDRQRCLTVLSKSDAAMRTIEIAVIDNGAGIDQASLGRIFEPLFTTRKGGLGLGLSICCNIVEAHGGRMAAALNADHGMVVRVTLPQAS